MGYPDDERSRRSTCEIFFREIPSQNETSARAGTGEET